MNAPQNSAFRNLIVLWQIFGTYRWQIIILITLGFVSAILDGIGINAMIPLISFYTNASSGPTDFISRAIAALFSFLHIPFTFRYLLVFILSLFMLRAVAITLFGYIRGRISADFMGMESESMLRRMMHASWPFLLKQKLGTLQATLVRDIQRIENLLSVFSQIIQSFSGFFIYLLVAMNISPIMTVSTLVAGSALLLAVRPLTKRAQATGNTLMMTEKNYAHFLGEHIIGMKAIKAAGVEESALDSGGTLVRTLRAISIRMALIRSVSGSLFQPVSLIFVIILFAITYNLPNFSMISFAAALYLIQKIFTYLESGQGALHGIRETIPYAQHVEGFKKMLDEHREASLSGTAPFSFNQEIAFQNVSFSYKKDKHVLSGVSFSIRKGETVGLIGPSGAGKTSVADLLLRLFKPNAGSLLLDGVPSESIALDVWRTRIGYVSQDVFLLNSTIEDNIRFYNSAATREDVENAAKQANIYDFIMGLPEGFSTITGDRGVMLSGGQRQRIALARALVGKPELLILDEATSALDHESEKLIHESIHALRGKVTVLIIAHRPSTVAEADTILVLSNGSIVEQGTPQQLLQDGSSYFSKMQRA